MPGSSKSSWRESHRARRAGRARQTAPALPAAFRRCSPARSRRHRGLRPAWRPERCARASPRVPHRAGLPLQGRRARDRKSTRLNSSHITISYAVFCLKKKKKKPEKILINKKKKNKKKKKTHKKKK